MTEQEWLACTDPQKMLEFLGKKVSSRKVRLYACACVKRATQFLRDGRSRKALDVAEKYADAQATADDLRAAGELATEAHMEVEERRGSLVDKYRTSEVDRLIALEEGGDYNLTSAVVFAAMLGDWLHNPDGDSYSLRSANCAAEETAHGLRNAKGQIEEVFSSERRCQADLIRCVFYNPFRSVNLGSAWLTPTVTLLAQAIYDERTFERLPALADALEGAGCTSQDILNHCRQPGVHVRGCWALDLVLGKE